MGQELLTNRKLIPLAVSCNPSFVPFRSRKPCSHKDTRVDREGDLEEKEVAETKRKVLPLTCRQKLSSTHIVRI